MTCYYSTDFILHGQAEFASHLSRQVLEPLCGSPLGGFLSGGCRGASSEDKEDCYGRATVALTRTIQLTYILSPVDMAGLPGMAQVLAVYHTGFYTLCHREVREYVHAIVPKDSAAVLEWSLLEPYAPRDHPPLAIPMMISD